MGRDPILGMNGSYRLSDPLLTHLLEKRIYFLAHAGNNYDDNSFTGWVGAQALHLTGTLATEWNDYIYKLRSSGLRLQQCKDSLF